MIGSSRIQWSSKSMMKSPGLNMVPLMDVFTILLFFLLINSTSSDVTEPPKTVKLPASYVESKPRETVAVVVTEDEILVQGESVVTTQEVLETTEPEIEAVMLRLLEQQKRVIGISERTVSDSAEVTVLAHKTIPFEILKKVMSSCTRAGYEKISLAVIQKSSQTK
jgi:biopolymer transport protein ExbD